MPSVISKSLDFRKFFEVSYAICLQRLQFIITNEESVLKYWSSKIILALWNIFYKPKIIQRQMARSKIGSVYLEELPAQEKVDDPWQNVTPSKIQSVILN